MPKFVPTPDDETDKGAKQDRPALKTETHQLGVVDFRTDYYIHLDNYISRCERNAAPVNNEILMLIEMHGNVWEINVIKIAAIVNLSTDRRA